MAGAGADCWGKGAGHLGTSQPIEAARKDSRALPRPQSWVSKKAQCVMMLAAKPNGQSSIPGLFYMVGYDLTEHRFHNTLELKDVSPSRNAGEWLPTDGVLAVAKMSDTVFFSFVLFLGSPWSIEPHSISVTEDEILLQVFPRNLDDVSKDTNAHNEGLPCRQMLSFLQKNIVIATIAVASVLLVTVFVVFVLVTYLRRKQPRLPPPQGRGQRLQWLQQVLGTLDRVRLTVGDLVLDSETLATAMMA
ncbi:hypothetical protein NN561_016239 [Cricetulus griseus]